MPYSTVVIRPAEKKDAASILALIKELALFEKAPHEVTNTIEDIEFDGFSDQSIFTCFIAEWNKEVVGIALLYEKYSTWKGRCTFLDDIVVKQEHRGNGIGKKLMLKCIEYAKNKKSKRLEWQVLNWNENAIKFYLSLGAITDSTWMNCKFTFEQLQKFKFPEN